MKTQQKAQPIEFNLVQKHAIENKSDEIIVSASAGSGKTTVMIERILRLLKEGFNDGVRLSNMIVCTFTKASASDMKAKLQRRLQTEYNEQWAQEALEDLPTSDITTIDSFCGKLLKNYFYFVGLDPIYELLDEASSKAYLYQSIDEVLEKRIKSLEIINKANKTAVKAAMDFLELYTIFTPSRNDNQLKKTLAQLFAFADITPNPKAWLKTAGKKASDHKAHLKKIEAHFQMRKRQYITRLEKLRIECGQAGFLILCDYLGLLITEIQNDCAAAKAPIMKKEFNEMHPNLVKRWKKQKLEIEKFCKEKENAFYSSSPQKTKPFVETLLTLTAEIIDTYNAKKKRKAQMDFSDIARAAVAILKDEKAQKEIAQKYEYLFVDEFQDINLLQDELFSSIKAKRFFVGDIKQSIYAFRLSDPKIFQEHITRVESLEKTKGDNADSTFIELNHNFRSCEGILKFCDAVFSSLLTPDFGGIAYKNFQASKGNALAAPVLCHHLVLEKDEKEETVGEENGDEFFFSESPVIPPIYSVKNNKSADESLSAEEAEIRWVVSHITNLKQQEITLNGKNRAVTGSDIAVLLRSGGKYAVSLAAELQKKGISAKFFNEQDPLKNTAIRALVSFLKLLDNRRDDILLASVLKSRFGDFCTDEDLIEIRKFAILDKDKPLPFNQAVWLYLKWEKANKALFDKISALETALNHYEKLMFALGASNLAGKISADYDLFKYAIIHDEAFALSQFLDALCGIDKGFSLREMLNAIDTNAIKIGSGAVENDSVQIMTMHAAKGLEFPFVVLANLTKRFNLSDLYGQVLLDSDLGAAIKLYDRDENILSETSLWHLMRLEKSKKMLEEELRLLYVALTRGIFQTALFSRMGDDYNPLPPFLAKSMMDFLHPHFIQKATRKRIEDFALEDKKPPVITHITEPADPAIFEAIKDRVNFVYPYSPQSVKLTATKIAQKWDNEEQIVPLVDFVPKEPQDKKGIEIGNAYHRFLETVDFSVAAINALQSFKGLYPQEYSLLNSKTATRCYGDIAKKVNGKKFYREIPFMYKDENGILVQGIIDLLILHDKTEQKTLEIIDYKTGNPSNEYLTAYQKQLDIYADIAAQILSIPTTKKSIYSINNGNFYDF